MTTTNKDNLKTCGDKVKYCFKSVSKTKNIQGNVTVEVQR